MEAIKSQGNAAFTKGNFTKAIELYRKALALVSDGKDAAPLHSNMSASLFKLGRYDEALEEAEECIRTKSEWSKGWFRKGEALFALKEYEQAEKAYKKAVDLSPEDVAIKQCMMRALEAQQGFYLRQLFAGRDFCVGKGSNVVEAQIFRSAVQMRNFVYLIGDSRTREVLVVDGAWDVDGILQYAKNEKVNIVGAIVTHHHFDHIGGMPPPPFDSLGIRVPGIHELAAKHKLKVYVNTLDAPVLQKSKYPVPHGMLCLMEDGDTIKVGDVEFKFMHTPGHTPGSQCVHVASAPGYDDGVLLSGDTLFIKSCGRLDLPGADPVAMHASLQRKLAALPDDTRVYPGHDYGGCFTTIGEEKATGFLREMTQDKWLALQGRS